MQRDGSASTLAEAVTAPAGSAGMLKATASRVDMDRLVLAVRDERRRHHRVPGNGTTVTLQINDLADAVAVLRDISEGGASLAGEWLLPPGHDLDLDLPNGAGLVACNVIRCKGGFLVAVLHRDQATRERVASAMDAMVRRLTST